jgi:hypothetical protein
MEKMTNNEPKKIAGDHDRRDATHQNNTTISLLRDDWQHNALLDNY